MRILSRWTKALALAAVFAGATTATAQTTHHVARSKIVTGPWTLTPIYASENGTPGAVVSFLALANQAALGGDNLIAVWYQRDATEWTAQSWETTDPWEAIKSVKASLAIPDDEDDRWAVSGSPDLTTMPLIPEGYLGGLPASDPLAPFIAFSADRNELVAFLVSIGYKAADVPVEKDDGCGADAKLNGFADMIEQTLAGEEETMVARATAAWTASGTTACTSVTASTLLAVTAPTPTSTITTQFFCETAWYYNRYGSPYAQKNVCFTWTQTGTVSERQTQARLVGTTYQFCDQTRAGTTTQITKCCITTGPFPPCPSQSAPPAVGVGCTPPATPGKITYDWSDWAPPCLGSGWIVAN